MRTTSLLSTTATPCGVEGFARGLAAALGTRDGAPNHETFPLTGQPGEFAILSRVLDRTDALIVNFPVVAWKRRITGPLKAIALARRKRRAVIVILHEWADLDWKRRLTYAPAVMGATRLLFSSPTVRDQFESDPIARVATRDRGIVPIPPNLALPSITPVTPLSERLSRLRADGTFILGHFGAIYPKKQSIAVLDVAARLRDRGRKVHTVFIGSFIGNASVDPKAPFEARMRELNLEDDVTITGYIGPSTEVFAAIEACDALVYLLPDGLTSRRGSVLAGLQTSTPVVVNGARRANEFDHHPSFRRALDAGDLVLLAPDAEPPAFAAALSTLLPRSDQSSPLSFDAAWADTAAAVDIRVDVAPVDEHLETRKSA